MDDCSKCLSAEAGIKLVKGLYGSEFEKNRACGYCVYHHCYLTVKQVKQHNCLGKQCWHLKKNEQHDWWRQRDVIKRKRKEKKKHNYQTHKEVVATC